MSYQEATVSWVVNKRAPAWFTRTPDRTWTKVACGPGASGVQADQQGARISDAWPATGLLSGNAAFDGGRPQITAYSGGALDQVRGEFWIAGGGHGDYPGNEPYVLALRADTPTWSALANPSPGAYVGGGNTHNGPGQYASDIGYNGAPQSSHTYNRLVYANDRLWIAGLGSQQWGTPYCTSRIFSFDRRDLRWRAHGYLLTDAEATNFAAFTEETACIFIPQDNLIWTSFAAYYGPDTNGPPITVAIDATTGALVRSISYNYPNRMGWRGQYAAVLIPGTRYVFMASASASPGGSSAGAYLWNAATPDVTPVRLTVTDNTGGVGYATHTRGLAWHTVSGCALQTNGNGENLVKIAPNTPGVWAGPWTASIVTPANTADPTRVQPVNGASDPRPYGRVRIVDDMGDGRSGLVMHPDTPRGPTYVMPLPAGGL